MNLQKMLVYRASIAVTFVLMSMWVIAYVSLIEVIFYHTQTLAGWTKGEMLIMMSFYYYMQNFSDIFFKDNIEDFGETVRRGELDFKMTKPAPLRLLCFFWEIRFDHTASLIATTFLLMYGLKELTTPLSPILIVAGCVLLFVGIVLYYSILSIIAALTFWVQKNDTFNVLIYNISQMSRYPRQIYKGVVGKIITFGLPLALLASLPTEVMLNFNTGKMAYYFIGITIVFYAISRTVWYYGVRAYSSAN